MDRKALISEHRLDAPFDLPPDQPYAIAPFKPEDALGLARLTYSTYADKHPFDYVYDPAEIARLYASGSQYALVAKADRGDVLGMIGIYRCAPEPRLFELAQLMIRTNQRKKGMAGELWVAAMGALPAAAQACAIFGEAVCTHTFSQRMCQETGMMPCGVVMDAIPAQAFTDGCDSARRTSLMLHMKLLRPGSQSVFMPEAYRQLFERYCRARGLTRQVRAPSGSGLARVSRLEVIDFAQAGCIKIWVHEAGDDLPAVVAEHERKAGEQGGVQVVLNLGDRHAPAGIESLRAMGYYWGGFLPLWFGADGLLLQRRKLSPCFSEVVLHNEEARFLLDFAEADMRAVAGRGAPWGASLGGQPVRQEPVRQGG